MFDYTYTLASCEAELEMYFVVCFEITALSDGREEAVYDIVSGGETLGNKSYRECTVVSPALSKDDAEELVRLLTTETVFCTDECRFYVGAEFIRFDEDDAVYEDCIFATDAEGRLFVVTEVSDDFETFRARKANRDIPEWTYLGSFRNIPKRVSLREAYFEMKCVSKCKA